MFKVVSRDKDRAGLPYEHGIDHLVFCFEFQHNAVAVANLVRDDLEMRPMSQDLIVEVQEFDPDEV